jgi:hypothetical protein
VKSARMCQQSMRYAGEPRRCLSVAHDATRPYHEHNSSRVAQHNQDPITLISAGMTTNVPMLLMSSRLLLNSDVRGIAIYKRCYHRNLLGSTRSPDAFTRRHSAVDHDLLAVLPLRFPRKAGDDYLV